MNELYRVLKKGGSCIIQTPFKDGEIYEDDSIKTAEDRLKYFGQEDHVRIYSLDGLEKRLNQSGFDVNIEQFNEEENNYNGFNPTEYLLIGRQ